MRKFARLDANHAAVVKALRKAGCMVQSLAAVGSGVPDIVALRQGVTYWLEIKDGAKVPSARALTDDERDWHTDAFRHGVVVKTVESVEQALMAVGVIKGIGNA